MSVDHFISNNFSFNDPELVSVIDEVPFWSAPFGMKLLETIKLKKQMKVLDVGSGLGFPMLEIANRLDTGSRVYGLDPWKEANDRVNMKIDKCRITNAEVIEGTAEKIPFDDEYFDLAVSNNGTNNVDDLEKTYSEIARVLKTGGQFAMTVNLQDTMIEFYTMYETVLKDNGQINEIIKMKDHIYQRRRPLKETEQSLIKAGLKIKDVIRDYFTFHFVDGSAMFNHFLIRLAFLEPWKEILNPEDVEPVFTEIERRLNQQAEDEGGIKLTVPFATIDCEKDNG